MGSTELVGEELGTGVIRLEDCKVGDWVEVKSGRPEPWLGQISEVDRTKPQPIAVKWLGRCTGRKWPSNTPDGLWQFRGGSHFVEVQTLFEVSAKMFHWARRKNMPEGLPCKEENLFCFSSTCNKRCSTTTLQQRPPPKLAPAPLAPTALAVPAAVPAAASKISISNNGEMKKRKYGKGEIKSFDWEPNVTGDCRPGDVLVPFTYITDRVYSLDGNGEYVVERRCEGRCYCKRSLEALLTERLGEIQDLHAGANGNCPYQALQGGRILFRLHIFQDTVGKGYGIRTKERIPKGGLVCEYVGEVITQVEATKRERSYSQLGLFYLHDIHGKGRYTKDDSFTIDPTIYGNVARMLNHSCEPNVTTLEVTVARDNTVEEDDIDQIPRVPRAGFFASRDIQANEELCIDYSPGRHGDELQRVIQCFCGVSKCKGWLF
mmetsp:Transcript_19225/g.31098  ORF Transcript_19225/g.31098 Transcript_19225/m.31098 type:complete len:433 (-) Transcript_19225:406-1704(-)